MLEPYSIIQDRESHGDIIVWPLKALNDYIEATGDFGFLDEKIAWRREDNFETTARTDSDRAHISTSCCGGRAGALHSRHASHPLRRGRLERFAAARRSQMRDWMVSSWTVALLFEQINRYAEILRRARPRRRGRRTSTRLADAMRAGLQPLSSARRHGRRLWNFRAGGRAARAAAASKRHAHRLSTIRCCR